MPEQDRKGAWHQSTLENLLDGCSWQYYLEYVRGLPSGKASTVSGSAFHAGVELHEQARLEGQVLPELGDMLKVGHDFLASTDFDGDTVRAEVEASLSHWWGTPTKDGNLSHRQWVGDMEPVGVEQYFKQHLVDGALPVAGTVDAIYRQENGGLLLVDWKTAGSLSRWGHEGSEHRRQATLYSVMLMLEGQAESLQPMTYCVVRRSVSRSKQFEGARRVTVTPSLADVETLGNRIRQAEQVVAEASYVRNPEWVLCSAQWCPFYQECMVTGEASPYTLGVPSGRQQLGQYETDVTENSVASTTRKGA